MYIQQEYPRKGSGNLGVLKYIRDHLEAMSMCLSCIHCHNKENPCPAEADAEFPCAGHTSIDNLMAENITHDIELLEPIISQMELLKKKYQDEILYKGTRS